MRSRTLSLRTIDAFANLPADVLRGIESLCHWHDVAGDRPILDSRSGDRSVYFLVEGHALALLPTSSGRTVELCELHAGQMFGEISAIDGRARSAWVVARTPCVVARLEGEHFCALIEREPLVMKTVLRHLTGMVRTLTARVFELSVLAVPARLQAELLRIALEGDVSGDSAIVRRLPTHTELANRIATAREVVSREIGRLDRLGIIERRGTVMRVPSLSRLDEIVREALGDIDDVTSAMQFGAKPAHGPASRRIKAEPTPNDQTNAAMLPRWAHGTDGLDRPLSANGAKGEDDPGAKD